MAVLMMGLMEGIYLRHHGLISMSKGLRSEAGSVLIPLIVLVLIGLVWYAGVRPFKAEMEHFSYKTSLVRGDRKTAKKHILKAIYYDPHNSAYHLYAGRLYMNLMKDYVKASDYIEKAIIDFNGDITMYSAYFMK